MGHMIAKCSKESPAPIELSGSGRPPLEQDVAQRSTQTVDVYLGGKERVLDLETVQILLCLLEGFMAETWSSDVTAMAFYAARDYAKKYGVNEDRFAEIANAVFEKNEKRRKLNPFVSSGFIA